MNGAGETLRVMETGERRIGPAACTLCGCVCDDLQLTVVGERIVAAEGACELARPWLLGIGAEQVPPAEIEGQPAAIDDALAQGVRILEQAQAPLVYGLSRSSTPGQRAAAELADRLGATVDTTASLCHANSVMAVQQAGEQTCTLGEVRNRADLVIYWGSNPAKSHPRHAERYAVDPRGEFVPGGRCDRYVVVADVRATESTALADCYLPITPGRDFDVLWALRGLVRGLPMDEGHDVGAPWRLLCDLAARMRRCRFGIVFFGFGLSMTGLGAHNVEALLRLVRDLNDHTRFYARRMRISGDVTGADLLLAWQTGYPFSVNLGRGYPRYNPGEFSAEALLERDEVDAVVLLGSERVHKFSPAARRRLESLPTISLDPPGYGRAFRPTVRFTTSIYGIHHPGTAYRMDEVPIPLRRVLTPVYPADHEVLERLLEKINTPARWGDE